MSVKCFEFCCKAVLKVSKRYGVSAFNIMAGKVLTLV